MASVPVHCALSGLGLRGPSYPGRCPGLLHCAPSGLPPQTPSIGETAMDRITVRPLVRFKIVLALAPILVLGQTRAADRPATITTPKEHFGFNIGDDYCLANYKQLEAYWHKLEGQTDRLKVFSIGK